MSTASSARSYFNRRWLVVRCLFAVSCACVGTTALAGPNTWTGDVPWGGAARDVAVDPQDSMRILAVSGLVDFGRLHRSSDTGATWQRVDFGNASLDDASIINVEVSLRSQYLSYPATQRHKMGHRHFVSYTVRSSRQTPA